MLLSECLNEKLFSYVDRGFSYFPHMLFVHLSLPITGVLITSRAQSTTFGSVINNLVDLKEGIPLLNTSEAFEPYICPEEHLYLSWSSLEH